VAHLPVRGSYRTYSSTIATYCERKLVAMRASEAQVKPSPHQCSLEVLEALARKGGAVGLEAARFFMLVRSIERRT
jgi:hypothetical protein